MSAIVQAKQQNNKVYPLTVTDAVALIDEDTGDAAKLTDVLETMSNELDDCIKRTDITFDEVEGTLIINTR